MGRMVEAAGQWDGQGHALVVLGVARLNGAQVAVAARPEASREVQRVHGLRLHFSLKTDSHTDSNCPLTSASPCLEERQRLTAPARPGATATRQRRSPELTLRHSPPAVHRLPTCSRHTWEPLSVWGTLRKTTTPTVPWKVYRPRGRALKCDGAATTEVKRNSEVKG